MSGSHGGYTVAEGLRTGGADEVRAALVAARERTLELADAYADGLASAGLRVPHQSNLNPPVWEWGHVAWFQEYWIARNRERDRGMACDPDHRRSPSILQDADTFYDSSRVAHADRWHLELPGPAQTRDYLAATLTQTLSLLDRVGLPDDDRLYFYRLAALHETMHAEAACYMARTLGIPLPRLAGPRAGAATAATTREVLRFSAQPFRLGSSPGGFAFDNELAACDVELQAFEIDARPVTWDRFMPFVERGGYREQRWWTEAGWEWVRACDVEPPTEGALAPHEAAVHLSAHEAEAWCRWAGRRLPTEAEWECAALSGSAFEWGEVWEWTSTPFEPYAGFTPHPYRDYSQPWFGTRRVLRGACRATSPALAHPKFRNFFEPHRRDVFAGLRSCA